MIKKITLLAFLATTFASGAALACKTDKDCGDCQRCSSNGNTGDKECIDKDPRLCGDNFKGNFKEPLRMLSPNPRDDYRPDLR